jgi:type IV pilus assembly protein PilP
MKPDHKNKRLRVLTALGLIVLVTGCVSKDMTDLENYSSEVLARPGGTIEPLPPIRPYERYLYQAEASHLRDPFQSIFIVKPEGPKPGEVDDPNQLAFANEINTHNREELEAHELDSLRMVGVLENEQNLWGIVRDQEGTVHRVLVGNYVGTNFGKIINIQEDRIDIREIIKDSVGRWEERAVNLSLSEE